MIENAVLEAYQILMYDRAGQSAYNFKEPSAKAKIRETIELMRESGLELSDSIIEADFAQALPTPIQDPFAYAILSQINDRVVAAASEIEQDLGIQPLLGSAPVGSTSAKSLSAEGTSRRIIIFDGGAFTYAWLCCKAIVQLLPIVAKSGTLRVRTFKGALIKEFNSPSGNTGAFRLRNAMMAYMVRGDSRAAIKYSLGDLNRLKIAQIFAENWETFILGHEYGHSVAHAAGVVDKHQAERDADSFAVRLTSCLGQSQNGVFGGYLYLKCADILERGISYFHHGVDEPLTPVDSHPPPGDRLASLLENVATDRQRRALDGLSFMFEELFWPTLCGAIDLVKSARGEQVHSRWNWRLSSAQFVESSPTQLRATEDAGGAAGANPTT